MCKAGYTGDGLDCRRKYSQTSRKRTILRQRKRRSSGPFRKWSLPFLGQKTEQQNVSILKKEKNRTPGSNSDLSYSNLSSLPLVYYSDTQPSKSRKRLLHNLANCLSWQLHKYQVTLALYVTFNVNSTWASRLFFQRLFNNVLFLLFYLNPGNALYLSWLKARLPMVESTV